MNGNSILFVINKGLCVVIQVIVGSEVKFGTFSIVDDELHINL